MFIAAMIVMLLALAGLLTLTGRQIFQWLRLLFGGLSPLWFGVIYGLLILIILGLFAASRVPGIGIPRAILRLDHYALGVLVYLVMTVNVVSLLLRIFRLLHLIPSPVPPVARLISGAVSLLLAAGFVLYGSVHAANIQTRRYAVTLGEPGAMAGELRVALISDLHLGYVVDEAHLEKIVTAVNAMQPDIVCIAGDIFDGDMTALKDPQRLQAQFLALNAQYGVYACLGNHDAGESFEGMLDFLRGAGVKVLMDEAVIVDGRFVLAGRRDSSPIGAHGEDRSALRALPQAAELPVIVLDHQPGNIGEYEEGADLILCGHTHKGQIFPFGLITDAMFTVHYGYYRAPGGTPQVIVTSGAGTWGPPQRVASDSEVVEIRITLPR